MLDLAYQPPAKKELTEDDELYLFSSNGKEAIVAICGAVTYYRIYNVDPRKGEKIIYLKKREMTIVKDLNKKCRKVDYDAKRSNLIFFMDTSTAFELRLTLNHDGVLTKHPDPKLIKIDNFRGISKPYEGIESQWPLHLRNGRTLFYNDKSNEIEMIKEVIMEKKIVQRPSILTNYGNYVKALLYFPVEYIEDDYIALFRNKTAKFPISFFGIVNCTVFVIMKYEDFSKVDLSSTGCDRSYQMRAILLDSYITILRTKNGINVEGLRIKASIDYKDVEKGIQESAVVAYTHSLSDADFEANNSFTIAPNTFNIIYNIGEFTYYQYKPRHHCSYFFRRRKITKKPQKEVEDIVFPILSVSYQEFMKYPCDFELSSAMYDESVPGVIYVMRRGSETVLATPNAVATNTLKFHSNERFLAEFIYSISLPYVLYNDSKGPSVLSIDNPQDVRITFSSTFDSIGIYTGKILYREAEVSHILHMETEAIEERINDTVTVTKAMAKRDFEKAAFGVESEIIGRPEVHTQKCRLVNAPYFMTFVLKVAVLDMLLLLVLIVLVIYHRAQIIPARRRYKIKMGILKHRKKRKLRDRARRRLRKLNIMRRRNKMKQQEMDAKRQAELLAAAIGRLDLSKPSAPPAPKQKKSSSTSSSDLITAGGTVNLQSQAVGPATAGGQEKHET